MTRLILASQSPRRKELLEQAHVPFQTISSDIEEWTDPALSPGELVVSLAEQKAEAVFRKHPENIVLGSDTVVAIGSEVLGKPADGDDARSMLRKLSGTSHSVYTGVAVIADGKRETFYEKSDVYFYPLTDEEIDAYIRSGEPFDKAGSYGIQGLGAVLVERISGDYFAIVGLPLARTVRVLKEFGVNWQA
ncbi:septum formation inhibitor Maf [Alteribacter lacisalsi]|uniref:dTTP/UTP pyrophosphatase n=1 Tax=Alteribacter lacisalsi TaxID=2045244 RepID=A0A2W0H853_9BACI|nr:Maf family protein [Alteribacter lacisalsi]PYZ97337.1 septum formation inhibitor Maf [Alteribacter lacisalsi]